VVAWSDEAGDCHVESYVFTVFIESCNAVATPDRQRHPDLVATAKKMAGVPCTLDQAASMPFIGDGAPSS